MSGRALETEARRLKVDLVFDIETNGFLDVFTEVHCIVIYDLDREMEFVYHTNGDFSLQDGSLHDGVHHLLEADNLIGHNIQSFDIPALEKHYGVSFDGKGLFDTHIVSRLGCPDLKDKDFAEAICSRFPRRYAGHHTLEAWGHRLGEYKGGYDGDFSEFTEEMLEYCIQDVKVNVKLYKTLAWVAKDMPDAFVLEHKFARVLDKAMRRGVKFNEKKAEELVKTLQVRLAEIDRLALALCPGFTVKYVTPKKKLEREKFITFNPGSRDHIAKYLIETHQWKPQEYTPGGKPKIDEKVLGSLGYHEAALFAERFTIQKRLGQIADGNQAWLKKVKNGRIHGRIIHNATITGRCAHASPNLGQVPAVRAQYGKECRELFEASAGYTLVGADASGLELRMLAHYMRDEEFTRVLLEGDIHAHNQKLAGLSSRDDSKKFIYMLLYGAHWKTIAVAMGLKPKQGKRLVERFLKKLPALARLKEGIHGTVEDRGYLRGLDGRRIPIRSEHAELNSLLQCAGAVVVKQWTVLLDEAITEAGLCAYLILHVHDELQLEVGVHEHVGAVKEFATETIVEAGELLGLRCALAGESKSGQHWADTH